MTTYRAWNLKPLNRSALKELTAAIAQQNTEELESRAMETMDVTTTALIIRLIMTVMILTKMLSPPLQNRRMVK